LLNENEAKRLLAAAGVPVTRERLARDATEAASIASEIGFPVVLKAQARALSHKSDAGGVVLNLSSSGEVRDAFNAIAARVRSAAGLELEGCLVQEMVKADVEVIVGSHWDPQFGAMVLVGIGGTLVELQELCSAFGIQLLPLSVAGAYHAGQAHRAYRTAGGGREKLLADFLIGGEAQALGADLLTRDPRPYRRYFPNLTLITPETDA
jgi:succinyl-CoA synthetase beta subunit